MPSDDLKSMNDLLEMRRLGDDRLCRVPIEVIEKRPELFDKLYDLSEKRLGGPCAAGKSIDESNNRFYLYFWNRKDPIIASTSPLEEA